MIDCSLSESKAVKLAINVVLNVLTQTRSLVALRLNRRWHTLGLHSPGDCKQDEKVFGLWPLLQNQGWCCRHSICAQQSSGIHSQHKPRGGALSAPSPQAEVLLAQLQPHFHPCQDQPSLLLAPKNCSKLHSSSLLRWANKTNQQQAALNSGSGVTYPKKTRKS